MLIAHLKLQIEKLNRDRYGPRSERTARLLDQLELTLEELESSATEDELAAEMAAAKTTKVASFVRKRPSRQPLHEHPRIGCGQLMTQLLGFGSEKHDDAVDALVYLILGPVGDGIEAQEVHYI